MNRSINLRPRQIYSAFFSFWGSTKMFLLFSRLVECFFFSLALSLGQKIAVLNLRCSNLFNTWEKKSYGGTMQKKTEYWWWSMRWKGFVECQSGTHTQAKRGTWGNENSIRNNKFNQKAKVVPCETKKIEGESCRMISTARRNFHSVTFVRLLLALLDFLCCWIWAFELSDLEESKWGKGGMHHHRAFSVHRVMLRNSISHFSSKSFIFVLHLVSMRLLITSI